MLSAIVGAGLGGQYLSSIAPQPAPVLRPALPAMVEIPALSLKTNIESVTQDDKGNMGTPQDIFAVGWYSLGARPGEAGNAVLGGHYNTPELTPGIFANLHLLQPGDEINIFDYQGLQWKFKIYEVDRIPVTDFPVNKYFGSSKDAKLHLITCEGDFDQKLSTFSERTIVSALLVAEN